jgi:hypothetical protein
MNKMKGVTLSSCKNIMQQPEHYVEFLQEHDVTIWTQQNIATSPSYNLHNTINKAIKT